jgi:hypothetical protein
MMKEKKFNLQDRLIDYTDELISILFQSIETAKKNNKNDQV